MILRDMVVRHASNRLVAQEYRRQHPDYAHERIERPIVVVGLPRSGTTHLLNLLGVRVVALCDVDRDILAKRQAELDRAHKEKLAADEDAEEYAHMVAEQRNTPEKSE